MLPLHKRITLNANNPNHKHVTLLERFHIDGYLLVLLTILAIANLFILYSASGKDMDLVNRQGTFFIMGGVAMIMIAQFDPRFMARWVLIPYIIGIILLIIVDINGHNAMGAQRWLKIPGLIRFQPSEFMKIVVPATIAWYISRHSLPASFKHVVIAFILTIVPFLLVLKQPDLGTSLLILTAGAFVIYMAGLRWSWVISAILAIIPIAYGMWHFVMHDYQKHRVLTFINPESDPLGKGWNIIQSKAAIGSGGFWGKGWLEGTQSHLDFLPESHTDFVFALIGEEFGLVGVTLLLTIYLLIITRCLIITANAQTLFGKLLAGGLSMTFFVYVFVNIGMVSGLLPVVGVPLPFMSYGGTSAITLLSSFGILMAIQTHRNWTTSIR
ncbi:rod shape-determining protein RodA [Entomomonas moraniae]|uniref:Peptidoglycan glycosyltransferase MrdB n=1 Tax=Entomomonas moraniae TaxID=2213226 RepID=A0A3Q9JLW7_9GAMM|nr:rod shape-determining protein RodA [Entomomonas moraniae]AZS51263.1 rod shape-determining protein RodA [Entomomonas moraniae]